MRRFPLNLLFSGLNHPTLVGQSQEPITPANTSTGYLLATSPWRGCRCSLRLEHAVKPLWEDPTAFCQPSNAEVHLLVGDQVPQHGGGCSQKSPPSLSPSLSLSIPGNSCSQEMPQDGEQGQGPGGQPLSPHCRGTAADTNGTMNKCYVWGYLPPFPWMKKATS